MKTIVYESGEEKTTVTEEDERQISANSRRTESKKEHDDVGQNSAAWLNLSLGGNTESSIMKTASSKVFSCNFCVRKFFSAQSLGGHQNGHKRERSMARRSQSQPHSYRMPMMTMASPPPPPLVRSLGVRAHSPLHKPPLHKEGIAAVARFDETRSSWTSFGLDEASNFTWPRSFYMNSPASPVKERQELINLDLSLGV